MGDTEIVLPAQLRATSHIQPGSPLEDPPWTTTKSPHLFLLQDGQKWKLMVFGEKRGMD